MLGNFSKGFSQMFNFPSGNFPKSALATAVGTLAFFYPPRSAPYPILATEFGPFAA